jgi:hypothetical protein
MLHIFPLDTHLFQIQKKLSPAFDLYADGWPIRDMMMQYMANSKQSAKKRREILDADKENVSAAQQTEVNCSRA